MQTSRRTLFRAGLALGTLIGLGGIGLALRPSILRSPRAPLLALTPRQFSTLAAVADRIDPGGDGLPTAWELRVPEKVDALLAKEPPLARDVTQVLDILENALVGLILDRRFSTFTGSPPEVQDRILTSMSTSRVLLRRTMYKALKGLCSASYWSDPATYAHVGYPGPPDYGNLEPR